MKGRGDIASGRKGTRTRGKCSEKAKNVGKAKLFLKTLRGWGGVKRGGGGKENIWKKKIRELE
jgi:hypothetical protein